MMKARVKSVRARRATRWAGMLAAAALAALAPPLFAHGDLHEQIEAVTAQIQKSPASSGLYLNRAELYRLHEEWSAAAGDYDFAEKLAPGNVLGQLGRAKMHLAVGRFDEAKTALDTILETNPGCVDALITRARVEMKRDQPLAAANDFGKVISLSREVEPDYFLDCARALVAAGEDHIPAAQRCLDEGLVRLGNLPSLGLYAVELAVRQKQIDAALARIDQFAASSPRKEAWLERRGDILAAAGRDEEAVQAYRSAQEALSALPAMRRQTKAMVELEGRLRSKALPVRRGNGDGEVAVSH
jgi:predicted Zn-dependent protease